MKGTIKSHIIHVYMHLKNVSIKSKKEKKNISTTTYDSTRVASYQKNPEKRNKKKKRNYVLMCREHIYKINILNILKFSDN